MMKAFSKFCGNYNRRGAMRTRADGKFYLHSSLKPVYVLNILGYKFFPADDDALRIMTLYDRKRHKAFDIEYVTAAYFEFTKNNTETENQRCWKIFFITGEAPEDAPEYIKKAARVIDRANLNGEEEEMINRLEMAEEIYQNTLYAAQLDGRIEGEKIGEARGEARGEEAKALAIAQSLLESGMPIADISRHTGVSEDKIKRPIQ